jgi:hypothetical protein
VQWHELDDSALVDCEITERCPEWRFAGDDTYLAANSKIRAAKQELKEQGYVSPRPSADQYRGWVNVMCHCIVPLAYIPIHFPRTRIDQVYGHDIVPLPHPDAMNVYVAETAELRYIERLSEAERDWWVTTKTTPPRIVLLCEETIDIEPCQICNVVVSYSWLSLRR